MIACAVADADRTDEFGGAGGSVSFHLGHEGERVEVRSITSLVRSGLPFPTFMKIDVEGAEALVLEGAREALSEAQSRDALPAMLVSVHDELLCRSCLSFMKALDYTVLGSRRISDFLSGVAEWGGIRTYSPSLRSDDPKSQRCGAIPGSRPDRSCRAEPPS